MLWSSRFRPKKRVERFRQSAPIMKALNPSTLDSLNPLLDVLRAHPALRKSALRIDRTLEALEVREEMRRRRTRG